MKLQTQIVGLFLLAMTALGVVGKSSESLAAPAASPWERTEFADVRLVSGVAGTAGRETVPLGLEFRLAEGWKVYWRSPGDAGYPPVIDWAETENLASADMDFPVPTRFSIFGLESYGYADTVVYPIEANLDEAGAPLTVKATVDALACSEICVPLTADLSLDLAAIDPAPTAFTQLLGRWQSRVPTDLAGIGLDIGSVAAVGDPSHPTLEISISSDLPLTTLDAFPEAANPFSFGKPEVVQGASSTDAVLRLPVGTKDGARIDGQPVTLTVVDGERFLTRTVTVGPGNPAQASEVGPAPAGSATLVWALGIALLGGLILNLMPCVLPVLSIKLLSVVSYGGAESGAIRRGFLASAAGIVVSFVLLAAGAIGLQAAGVAVGWGIQFQQPVFLAVMAAIVALFAANLAGWFEISLPRAVAGLAEGEQRGGLAGHFGTGMLATLLATPCSAPFVGTALGFALSRGPLEIVLVFAAMGVGLALPYLAVAAVPSLARTMPRPGPWMLWVKRVLALALLGTAVWLVSVIASQAGTTSATAIGIALLAMLVVLALGSRLGGAIQGAGSALAVVAAIVIAVQADRPLPVEDSGISGDVAWTVYDQSDLQRRIAAGEIILVDVTADWCITCKVNKRLVLDTAPVVDILAGGAVSAVRADWTNPDPAISSYLAGFGRYGIPFNVVYGPDAPGGIPLPELLSTESVLDAIKEAGGEGGVTALRPAQPGSG